MNPTGEMFSWVREGESLVLYRGASTAPSAKLAPAEAEALSRALSAEVTVVRSTPERLDDPAEESMTARWVGWGTDVEPGQTETVEVAHDGDMTLLVNGEPIVPTRAGRGGQPLPTEGVVCVQDAMVDHWGAEEPHRPLTAALVAYTAERKALGVKRYGRALETHNGRDPLTDAFEEAFDLCMYLGQLQLERGLTLNDDPYQEDTGSVDTFGTALDLAQEVLRTLGSALVGRDGKLPEVVE